ncbi:hypothetical protein MTR_4g063785 [Medicago truncatula]|uniref:Uncharacterized protein n=1 Tax=Medicago truncatula TaxID=3880 RepID=A0A072UW96_MEDTR|nr:hypothetical protein MTR_4g063785 [Medicago truncatula]
MVKKLGNIRHLFPLCRLTVQPTRGSRQSTNLLITGLLIHRLEHASDTLVRVSRQAKCEAHMPTLGMRKRQGRLNQCRGSPLTMILVTKGLTFLLIG